MRLINSIIQLYYISILQWWAVRFTLRPSVISYLVHPKLTDHIISLIWRYSSRIQSRLHITITIAGSSLRIENTTRLCHGKIVTWASNYGHEIISNKTAMCFSSKQSVLTLVAVEEDWREMKGKKDMKAEEGKSVIMPVVYLCVLKVRCTRWGLFSEHKHITVCLDHLRLLITSPGLQPDV